MRSYLDASSVHLPSYCSSEGQGLGRAGRPACMVSSSALDQARPAAFSRGPRVLTIRDGGRTLVIPVAEIDEFERQDGVRAKLVESCGNTHARVSVEPLSEKAEILPLNSKVRLLG
mgnify:CR=1 FL=1